LVFNIGFSYIYRTTNCGNIRSDKR
jgi:hypothetical protein